MAILNIPIASSPTSGSIFFRYRTTDGTPDEQNRFFRVSEATDAASILTAYHRTDGNIRAFHGSSYATSSTTPFSGDNTIYAVWIDYVLATGAGNDGTVSIYVATISDPTAAPPSKPGSPVVSVTGGTSLASVPPTMLQLRAGESGSIEHHYDQVLINGTTIGDVCQ
jgi:hypothetical protein